MSETHKAQRVRRVPTSSRGKKKLRQNGNLRIKSKWGNIWRQLEVWARLEQEKKAEKSRRTHWNMRNLEDSNLHFFSVVLFSLIFLSVPVFNLHPLHIHSRGRRPSLSFSPQHEYKHKNKYLEKCSRQPQLPNFKLFNNDDDEAEKKKKTWQNREKVWHGGGEKFNHQFWACIDFKTHEKWRKIPRMSKVVAASLCVKFIYCSLKVSSDRGEGEKLFSRAGKKRKVNKHFKIIGKLFDFHLIMISFMCKSLPIFSSPQYNTTVKHNTAAAHFLRQQQQQRGQERKLISQEQLSN